MLCRQVNAVYNKVLFMRDLSNELSNSHFETGGMTRKSSNSFFADGLTRHNKELPVSRMDKIVGWELW